MTNHENLLDTRLSHLRLLSEEDLRRKILIPLLECLGYQEVIEYHGSVEKGKDVIAYYFDPEGERRYVSFVVKRGNIHGSVSKPGSASEVLFQIQQSFHAPYTDVYGLRNVQIDEVRVVASGEILNSAIESISGVLHASNLSRCLKFIDGRKLYSDIKKHLPDYWNDAPYEPFLFLDKINKVMRTMSHRFLASLSAIYADLKVHEFQCDKDNMRLPKLDLSLALVEDLIAYSFGLISALAIEHKQKISFSNSTIDIKKLSEDIFHRARLIHCRNDLTFTFQTNTESTTIFTDRNIIESVVNEIIRNSFQFSYIGSDVHVMLEKETEMATQRLCISSQGPSIENHERETIFDKFERGHVTKNDNIHFGPGLGLWIVSVLAKSINGKVWLSSSYANKYISTFHVEIPL